jgi:hypothetical protein
VKQPTSTISQASEVAIEADVFEPLDPTPEFLAELAEQSKRLESATPEEIIEWAAERYSNRLTMATAFGP